MAGFAPAGKRTRMIFDWPEPHRLSTKHYPSGSRLPIVIISHIAGLVLVYNRHFFFGAMSRSSIAPVQKSQLRPI